MRIAIVACCVAGLAAVNTAWCLTLSGNQKYTISSGTHGSYTILYGNSELTVSGGTFNMSITAFDQSHVEFSGATMAGGAGGGFWSYGTSEFVISGGRSLAGGYACDDSTMLFSGGQIGLLKAWNNANLTITGGTVDGILEAVDNGRITIHGTDFKINGAAVVYGQTAQDFSEILSQSIDSDGKSFWSGIITGYLSDGTYMNNEFTIIDRFGQGDRGDIIIVPEPCTIFLFSVSLLVLSGRRL